MDSYLANFLYDITKVGAQYDREVQGHAGYIINDPLTIAYLVDETILQLKDCHVEIVTEGEQIGRSIVTEVIDPEKINAKFAYGVNVKEFYRILFTRLFPQKQEEIERIINTL